jgi:hypothetical protein
MVDLFLIVVIAAALLALVVRHWPRPEPPKNPCGFVW